MNQEEIIFPTNSNGEELAPYMLPLLEFYLNNEGSTDFTPEILDTASSAFLAYLLRRSKYGEPEYNVQFLPRTEFNLWRKYDAPRSSEPLTKYPVDSIGYETVLESLKDYVKNVVWPATQSRFPELPRTTLVPGKREDLPWFTKSRYRYTGLFGGNILGSVSAGVVGAMTEIPTLSMSIPISVAVAAGFILTSPYRNKYRKDVLYVSTFGDAPEEVYTYILECKNILANHKGALPDDWEIVLTQNYRLVDSK